MYYKHRKISNIALITAGIAISTMANAADYWVSKTGTDSNTCTDVSPCQTIQKGVSILSAGDTLNITAGTYTDDGGASNYAPPNTYCAWLDSDPSSSSICINSNGTIDNPITIQAAPGDEGQVIIDSQNSRIGIHIQNSDYVHIRGLKLINSSTIGIASWGQPENAVADQSRLSIGVVIENNEITDVTGGTGRNVSGIGMWGTKDWIVRNNRIDNITVASGSNASGIQSYGTINALVENNYITNAINGIYWKDHFIQDTLTRTPVFESEVRYNLIQASSRGVHIGIKGGGTVESGENFVHHNIIYGYSSAGIAVVTSAGFSVSGPVKFEHNLLDGNGSGNGISIDSSTQISLSGNIFLRNKYGNEFIAYSDPNKRPNLFHSDYNLFANSLGIITGRYSNSQQTFSSLSSWQSNSKSVYPSLNTSQADSNSQVLSYSGLFTDITARNYTYSNASQLKYKADNSSVGPYQTGNEVIGLLASWPSYTPRPMAPDNIQLTIQ